MHECRKLSSESVTLVRVLVVCHAYCIWLISAHHSGSHYTDQRSRRHYPTLSYKGYHTKGPLGHSGTPYTYTYTYTAPAPYNTLVWIAGAGACEKPTCPGASSPYHRCSTLTIFSFKCAPVHVPGFCDILDAAEVLRV